MDRFTAYLRVPSHYAAGMKGLHWSPSGDAIEFGNGGTFAFPGEIFPFLEGFASQQPLIHFAHIIHLLYMLSNPRTPFLGKRSDTLMRAFRQTQRPYRNAGVFCAILCADIDIPAVPDPLELLPFWTGTFELEVGASEPLFTLQGGDMPALPGEVFEARVLFALSRRSFEDVHHWFRHGRGPVYDAGAEVAEKVLLDKPRSLEGVLAELAQHQRLSGARPFVEQLVSALTLPPRRLEKPQLPLGGYSDVTTHGQVEQLLPSQFAFDDLEFARRHAERELLYFRREDPHIHTREDLVVLLDQGVRTWGTVCLVLTAALFALGRLAERRRLPFLVAATSGGAELLDPLHAPASELQEMMESSDLTAHPASALEHVLTQETDTARDIVLLTHPRNLAEPDVIAAARKLPINVRLFAVTVDDRGDVCFNALRGGVPVCLNRFHVDLERTAPPPIKTRADPQTTWRGDVESVPFPFRFGEYSNQKLIRFAFDAAGDWLLVATHSGMLHATRTDGSHSEILPRGQVQNTLVTDLAQVIGVAGGFVVISNQARQVLVLHYDFIARTCTAHTFEKRTETPATGNSQRVLGQYLRSHHLLLLSNFTTVGKNTPSFETWCLNLSTGDRSVPPFVQNHVNGLPAIPLSYRRMWEENGLFLDPDPSPDGECELGSFPRVLLDTVSGTLRLFNKTPAWEDFTPLADNKPALKGGKLNCAVCRGQTLAALVTKPGAPSKLHLFRGPECTPLAAFEQATASFTLSCDGRLLAREIPVSQVEVRDVHSGGVPRLVRWKGGFHPHEQTQIQLGERWLLIQCNKVVHLALWTADNLVLVRGKVQKGQLVFEEECSPLPAGVLAVKGHLPEFLPIDPGQRFVKAAWNKLIAVVDRFGEVALFAPSGELVCMFFAFRQQIAVWMPDGTRYGPMSLLGRPVTPHALEKIGAALRTAWQNSKGTAV